jgi:NTP pyrophosphatase (non-canonical NTP hydrolase)
MSLTIDFNAYQAKANITGAFHETMPLLARLDLMALGIAAEACEFALEVSQTIDRQQGKFDPRSFDLKDIILELGDIIWYISEAANYLGVKLDDLAKMNLLVMRKGDLIQRVDFWLDWSLRTNSMCGYCGHFADYIKKVVYHGHELDNTKAIEFLAFAFGQVREMATGLDIDMIDVLAANLDKIERRYAKGFSHEASRNRVG